MPPLLSLLHLLVVDVSCSRQAPAAAAPTAAGHAAVGPNGTAPALVPALPRVGALGVAEWHSAVVTTSGDVYVWGREAAVRHLESGCARAACGVARQWPTGHALPCARHAAARSPVMTPGVPTRLSGVAQAVEVACSDSQTLVRVALSRAAAARDSGAAAAAAAATAAEEEAPAAALPSLKSLCEQALSREVHVGNVGSLLHHATAHEAFGLATAAGAFAAANLRAVLACARGHEAEALVAHAHALRHGTCVCLRARARLRCRARA